MRLQTMKKTMLLMMTVMAGFSVVACKDNTTTVPTSDIITETNAVIPQLTNPDAVFYQSEDFSLTYGELYAEMKINDGLTQLLNMVDSQLLATEISAVTAEEIANKKNFLTYGTDDPDEIADISLENKADYEEFYEQNLVLAGYEDDEDDYLRLVVAKDNYALAAMKDAANSEETWFVGPSTIANYYSNTYREALSSLKIRFMSETEAKDVMKSLNLVGSLGKLYRYT
ncbi:MAG: hypothetical protein JXB20_05125, partial [Bacilli bacterium]|nr:hypothetical protein [Bacilli bacterium]